MPHALLQEKIEEKEFENLEPPAWYLLDHLTIKLNCPLLKIVKIVDLPGFGDANCVRDKIAERFIKTLDVCHLFKLSNFC